MNVQSNAQVVNTFPQKLQQPFSQGQPLNQTQQGRQPLQFVFAQDKPATQTDTVMESVQVTANVSLITVERKGMINALELVGKALTALAENHITLHSFTQSSSEGNFCMVIPQESAAVAMGALMATFEADLKRGVVKEIRAQHHLALLATSSDLCCTLAQRGINIINMTQGAAGSVSALVAAHDARRGGWL